MFLGFSTGCLYKNIETISVDAIKAVKSTGCNAIELYAGFKERVPRLNSIRKSDLDSFKYVSLHAPDDIIYDYSSEAHRVLEMMAYYHDRLDFDNLIIHGHNITSGDVFKAHNLPPVIIENHDKRYGKNVEEMEEIFNRFDADMVLDVLHSYIAGGSSKLTEALFDKFRDRIVQAHLSGLGKHDDSQQHYPINEMKQLDIILSVPKNIPVIIESVFPRYDNHTRLLSELEKEYSYVKHFVGK